MTLRGAREKEIRNIGASDQQHKTDREAQHQQRGPHILDNGVQERLQRDAVLTVAIGMQLVKMLCDALHLPERLRDAHAGPQPRISVNSRVIAAVSLSPELIFQPPQRCKDIRLPQAAVKPRWQHADDRERLGIKDELLANNAWISAETALPKPFAQQHDASGAYLVILGCQLTAEGGFDP